MAKKSNIARDVKRRRLARRFSAKRRALKQAVMQRDLSPEERFIKVQQLAALPRNSAPSRIHNRCLLTGRPRGFYRKMRISRLALRELASNGLIPGMIKASW